VRIADCRPDLLAQMASAQDDAVHAGIRELIEKPEKERATIDLGENLGAVMEDGAKACAEATG